MTSGSGNNPVSDLDLANLSRYIYPRLRQQRQRRGQIRKVNDNGFLGGDGNNDGKGFGGGFVRVMVLEAIVTIDQTPHIAILPSPGMGHLIPLAEFAERLVLRHNFSVTIIVPTTGPPPKAQKDVLQSLPIGVNHTFLPPVTFQSQDLNAETQIFLTIAHSLPSLRDTLKSLIATTHLVALVVDPFGADALDVAVELHVAPYLLFPTTAMTLLFCLHLPILDQTFSCEYRDLPEPLQLPGCVPVHGTDFIDPVQDRSNPSYSGILRNVKRLTLFKGVLVNTFMDMEEGAIKALLVEEPGKPPVYPIGTLIQTGSSAGPDGHECLQWLDNQPSGSVLFVAFGSGGTLSSEQLDELAFGLEMSGQRFLWVVRSPNERSANAAFFSVQSQDEPFGFLPDGFLDRTNGRGLVVHSWAPQVEVLSHGSTGGFVTHCGWNSTLESVVHGVPLITWPLYAEQKMNALMLSEGLKVALRPQVNEHGLVLREEFAKIAKNLMEGEEGNLIRNKMKYLQNTARNVLSEDGSSAKSLSELVNKWRKH
ncbi:hydroquinone glucosyltransferase-like [Cornus florida]|uniref:hydroquinone glucosyltransferase-like n=1 Tax=Cornus florida TaxID=4283 RepID=UPI0028A18EED|nr:hydroquinone glucosyltransferase-like [Cornus florida]